jgi:hypothetical protein
MNTSSVYCIATDEREAARVVERLRTAGFENEEISVLLPELPACPDGSDVRPIVAESHTKAGAVLGALGGLALAALAATGSVALPGASLLAAAGPVLAGLVGALAGAVCGIAVVVASELVAHEVAEIHARHASRLHGRLEIEPGR